MGGEVTAGFLHGDVPYLRVGQGPPLVMIEGLTPDHEVLTGWSRRAVVANVGKYAGQFTVYFVNRKRGLAAGESMSDIAAHLAGAIEADIGGPVLVKGAGTGGSVALQLAIDRPDLVGCLVLVMSAYRLGEYGRALQAELANRIRAGDAGNAWADFMTTLVVPPALQRPARPLARPVLRRMMPADPSDLLITLDAEDAFDAEADLHRVTAPTLVIGGSMDRVYTPELYRATAAGVRNGRAHIFPGWGPLRTDASSATTNLTLGFLLAAKA